MKFKSTIEELGISVRRRRIQIIKRKEVSVNRKAPKVSFSLRLPETVLCHKEPE